jgi:hypothetical protein
MINVELIYFARFLPDSRSTMFKRFSVRTRSQLDPAGVAGDKATRIPRLFAFFSRRGRNQTKKHPRGQSFVELALVMMILLLMLAGVVEFGYLLNSYLKVLDGAREGARYMNAGEAFNASGVTYQSFYVYTAIEAMRVMAPIPLKGNNGDDIVVSVFTVAGSSIRRWPDGLDYGWSVCNNKDDALFQTYNDLIVDDWSGCTPKNSHFSTTQVLALTDATAPDTGILLVEVYYNYPQILKLPIFSQVIPDPIPVYTYSVMPLSSAEPTSTPLP